MNFFGIRKLRQWTLLAILASPALGKLYTSPDQLSKTSYDYVVVGAGAAGGVVAARLSEDSSVSVLVLEAGPSNEGVAAIQIPLLAPTTFPNTPYDWNYSTTAQPGYNGRSIEYPRGHVLGGSTSINDMTYSRGSIDDWNRYAAVTGDSGWNWNNIQPYIKKNENFVPPADHHNINGQYDPSKHSTGGAIDVSLSGFPTVLDSKVIATTQELPAQFPFTEDTSGGNTLGVGWAFATLGNGERSSSATGYLEPAINRPNLDVVINAQVTKLIQTGTTSGIPSFKSVQFTQSQGAATYNVTANKEVILSAGSIGSIAILQLSGIGDPADLQSVGIPSIVNSPSVGKNLSDHVLQYNVFNVASNQTLDDLFRDQNQLNAALTQWNQNRTGPLVYPLTNQVGWLRLPQNASIFQTTPDPSAGPNSAHFEMIFIDLLVLSPETTHPTTGHYLTILTALISPTSRGSVKISSTNPFDKPLINPNYLSSDFDTFTIVESVKAAKEFASAPAWNGFVTGPFGALANATTDAEILEVVRNMAGTIAHPIGTASMSPKGAKWGVVDPDLKVKGINGLRIIDGSVLPFIPSAHTVVPIYLIAERASDLIKQENGSS